MDQEMTLDLRDFSRILQKRLKLILIITITCTLISGILSFFVIKPTYQAQATIIVGKPQATEKNNTQYNDVMMYQNLVKTYAEIAKSRAVAQKAVDKLNSNLSADQFSKIISVTPAQGTQILTISATSKDPKEAAQIVDTVSSTFIDESKKVFPTGGDIQIMDTAKVPEGPIKPKKVLNVAIAFFIGLMASVGLAFILEHMDSTIKTEDDISRYLDLPVIGIIPKNMQQ
jgi:capsular polysaccharide biosynthesis protein